MKQQNSLFKYEILDKSKFNINNYIEATFYVDELSKKTGKDIIVVCPNTFQANRLYSFLSLLDINLSVLLFPEEEMLYASTLTSSSDLLAQRLSTLIETFSNQKKIIITTAVGFCRYLPEPSLFKKSFIKLKKGNNISIKDCCQSLIQMGYKKVGHVSQTFDFAVRGDLIDIFSINYDYPVRISMFDDTVEFMSFFHIEDQVSFKKIDEFIAYPASDIIFDETEKEIATKEIAKTQNLSAEYGLDIVDIFNQNNYKYYSSLKKTTSSILDYIKNPTVVFFNNEMIETSYKNYKEQSEQFLSDYKNPLDAKKSLSLVYDFKELEKKCENLKTLQQCDDFKNGDFFPNKILDLNLNKLEFLYEFIRNSKDIYSKVVICVENKYQLEILEDYFTKSYTNFKSYDHLEMDDNNKYVLCIFPLYDSFEIIGKNTVVISCSKIFGLKTRRNLIRNKFKRGIIINNFQEITPGDYLVHENYGIGKFVDIVTLEVSEKTSDYLKLEYAKKQILYIPLNQFKLVRKYRGAEGFEPKLNSLNDGKWAKTKALVEEKSIELSNKLKALYKERASLKGFKFSPDEELQKEFENDFPYNLTDDQQLAVDSIKDQMESGKLIDYLVCGDVGFGKTEVAMRIIFKTIVSGFQTCLLCPTTVLAKQHFLVAQERFEKYGVKVALFSRLVSEGQRKNIMEDLENGMVDLVIGTHSLLSKKVKFKNLGLLVIDEEQRFGVEQKETIKQLKNDVNVITLSATPIPRTLEMSLTGIRDLSIINTAPKERSPIQTYVLPYRKEIIKEVINKELSRDGQIYYVYNNVENIVERAHFISDLVPTAHIGIIHGQMSKNDIDKTLLDFFDGKINLLVCSSIIENGLDVPNANLLVVENSDMFGLAQLYQIRGRIGRSNRVGYAYLTYDQNKVLTANAKERLKSIYEFTALGSGYKISQKDLVIRGAGNIFGKEQAGFIDALGIDLYFQIINEAVKKAKKENNPEIKAPRFNLNIDSYFPEEYLNKEDKINIYSQIQNCNSIEEVNKIEQDITDIYGKIPSKSIYLFIKRKIEIILDRPFVEKVINNDNDIKVIFKKQMDKFPELKRKVEDALKEYDERLTIFYSLKFVEIKYLKDPNWLKNFYELLKKLLKIFDVNI